MTALICWLLGAAAAVTTPAAPPATAATSAAPPVATTPAASPAATDFEKFFADFAKARDGVQTLEAKFVQEKVTTDDPTPVKSTGTITYVKPRRILFRYDDPELVYLVDGQKVYEYNAKATQLQVIDLENDPQTEAFFLGFDDNTERLRQAYDIKQFTPDAKECGSKGLELYPKHDVEDVTKKQRSTFEKVRISLDGKQYLPCHIEVVNDKDSKTDIAISGIQINASGTKKELSITVPEHTTIVENNEKTSDAGPGGVTFPRPTAPKPPTIKLQDLKTP